LPIIPLQRRIETVVFLFSGSLSRQSDERLLHVRQPSSCVGQRIGLLKLRSKFQHRRHLFIHAMPVARMIEAYGFQAEGSLIQIKLTAF
jgi:hypothetical protein